MHGVNADQCTTAAQDEGKWRKTVEQGAECFMAKWITMCREAYVVGVLGVDEVGLALVGDSLPSLG